jgi:hypothetical protein
MVLNRMSVATQMAQTVRPKLIVKSLIFVVLLALAGIGIATGAVRSGAHPTVAPTAVTAVAPGSIAGG